MKTWKIILSILAIVFLTGQAGAATITYNISGNFSLKYGPDQYGFDDAAFSQSFSFDDTAAPTLHSSGSFDYTIYAQINNESTFVLTGTDGKDGTYTGTYSSMILRNNLLGSSHWLEFRSNYAIGIPGFSFMPGVVLHDGIVQGGGAQPQELPLFINSDVSNVINGLSIDNYTNSQYSQYSVVNWNISGTGSDQAPVPEPATMLLLGIGLIGLAGGRHRFKQKT